MGEEGYASLISCPVSPLEGGLRPKWLNNNGGERGIVKKSGNHFPLEMFHF